MVVLASRAATCYDSLIHVNDGSGRQDALSVRITPSLGSVSVAGARPGLQNRGHDAVSSKSHKNLRNPDESLTAQGQRAASNDPDLTALVEAWPKLPAALKAGIMAMIKASRG
jgi:hypothetical protein